MAERDSGNSWDSLWVDLGLEAPRAASKPKPAPTPVPPPPAPVAAPEPVAEVVPAPTPAPVERPRPVYLTSDEAPDIQAIPAPAPVVAAVEANDEDDDDEMIENNPDGTPGKKRRRRRRRGRKGGREDGSDLETPVAAVSPATQAAEAVAPTPPPVLEAVAVEDGEADDGEEDDGEELEPGVDMVLSEAEEIETFEAADQPSAMDEELDNEDATPEKKEWSVVSWSELVAGLNR